MKKSYPEPARPDGLPEGAVWNTKNNEWELVGVTLPDGKEVGDWLWWYPDGTMVCRCSYDDEGKTHGQFERFHPNGELSQWAVWSHGKVHGQNSWTKPRSGPPDPSFTFPPNLGDRVMRMDVPYDGGRPSPYHFTLYTIDGMYDSVPFDADGRSIDLASHLWRVAAETTLFLLEPHFEDIHENLISNDTDESVRWIFDGPRKSPDIWGVRFIKGSKMETYEVRSEEMSRAFTLSADYYLASLRAKRPECVPEGAIWNREDSTWEMGETETERVGTWGVKKLKVGPWQVWDNLGRLRKRENYSKYGVLHGEFEQLHPDGAPAIRGRYYKGELEEATHWHQKDSDVPFPGEEQRLDLAQQRSALGDMDSTRKGVLTVSRIESYRVNSFLYQRFFHEKGQETNRHGDLIEDVFTDNLFETSPEEFLANHFFAYVSQNTENESDGVEAYPVDQPFPGWSNSSLKLLHDTIANKDPFLLHWQVESLSELLVVDAREGDNRFERTIERIQNYAGSLELRESFYGVSTIGRASRGGLAYLVDVVDPAADSVWIYENDKGVQGQIASDLAAFVYLQCAIDAYENRGVIGGEALQKVIERVEGRCFPVGPFEAVMPESLETSIRRRERHPREQRSAWIVEALRGVEAALCLSDTDFTAAWPQASELSLERCLEDLSEAAYWMWRLFFVSDSERLEGLIEGLKEAPSGLIRDAANLLDEILWGREPLGSIEDIYEVRANLWATSLLPDAPNEDAVGDEDQKEHKAGGPRSFAPYLRRLSSWNHDPEAFWKAAMHAELATDEERQKARVYFEGLPAHLGPLHMPMARFALKRFGGDVDDVRMWVRTALTKEMNPAGIRSGENQKVWALRVAGEDESVEVDVLLPWASYPHEPIREAAFAALARKAPDMVVEPLPDLEILNAEQIADAIESMLSVWLPYAKEADSPEYLTQALERLQKLDDPAAILRASTLCLEHEEPAIFEASLRFAPPWDESLVKAMTKIEETATGWSARVARQWLETCPLESLLQNTDSTSARVG